MTTEINSARLIELIENAGYEARSYSGRAMYGRSCIGVTLDCSAADLIVDIVNTMLEPPIDDDGSVVQMSIEDKAILEALKGAREDSMGRSGIVYWPEIEWVEIEGGNKDEDDESEEDK